MATLNKGLVIAAAVAAGLSLAGCASQGGACGDTSTPVAAPAPMPVNACKNASSCKHKSSSAAASSNSSSSNS